MLHSSASKKSVLKAFALIVIIALLSLPLVACKGTISVTGPWHNETFVQTINFKSDGSVVLKTADGNADGIFVFDEKSGSGTLMLLGETLTFTVKGDLMQLVDKGGTQTEYKRGDMAIAVVTPVSTPVLSATPLVSAAATPSAPATAPILATLKPGLIIKPGDAIGGLLKSEIVGIWYTGQVTGMTIEYKTDKTYIIKFKNGGYIPGTYTYNSTTNKGVMTEGGSGSGDFTYDQVKNQIHFYYNGMYMTFIDQAP
jgi:hypothetical protein